MTLFHIEESYNLVKLKEQCIAYIKDKYPKPVEEEDCDDYAEFIKDESDLEFACRLRKIADQIEKRIYGEQKADIYEVYVKKGF